MKKIYEVICAHKWSNRYERKKISDYCAVTMVSKITCALCNSEWFFNKNSGSFDEKDEPIVKVGLVEVDTSWL